VPGVTRLTAREAAPEHPATYVRGHWSTENKVHWVRSPGYGGATARSAADRFTFQNPAPRLTGQLTPAAGDVAATGADVTAVTGGQVVTGSSGVSRAPWVVTLAAAAAVPAVGQHFLLENVEAHVEVDVGSLWSKPFVDVWVSYQPTLAFSLTAEATAECTLPAAWQNTHQKLFMLGDTGATIAIAPEAAFTVSARGTVSFQQHSYRILGFVSNPDGSIRRLSGQSSDPAQVKVSAELKVEAHGGVQVQVGELNIIGVGISLDGGVTGTASSDWPPQVYLSAHRRGLPARPGDRAGRPGRPCLTAVPSRAWSNPAPRMWPCSARE